MGQPAAKKNDQISATDIHIVMIPAGPAQVPTPLPHPFLGIIDNGLSSDVNIMGMPAATVDSPLPILHHIFHRAVRLVATFKQSKLLKWVVQQ